MEILNATAHRLIINNGHVPTHIDAGAELAFSFLAGTLAITFEGGNGPFLLAKLRVLADEPSYGKQCSIWLDISPVGGGSDLVEPVTSVLLGNFKTGGPDNYAALPNKTLLRFLPNAIGLNFGLIDNADNGASLTLTAPYPRCLK